MDGSTKVGIGGLADTKAFLVRVKRIVNGTGSKAEKLLAICKLLSGSVRHYHWVGFYLMEESGKRELVLGPFVGKPTEHVRIKFGEGICGQAADRRETFVVQDVSKESNYLSCSPDVKSEIVVPIIKNGKVVGELDIDSRVLAAFTNEDREFLERVCEIVSRVF